MNAIALVQDVLKQVHPQHVNTEGRGDVVCGFPFKLQIPVG